MYSLKGAIWKSLKDTFLKVQLYRYNLKGTVLKAQSSGYILKGFKEKVMTCFLGLCSAWGEVANQARSLTFDGLVLYSKAALNPFQIYGIQTKNQLCHKSQKWRHREMFWCQMTCFVALSLFAKFRVKRIYKKFFPFFLIDKYLT